MNFFTTWKLEKYSKFRNNKINNVCTKIWDLYWKNINNGKGYTKKRYTIYKRMTVPSTKIF